MPKFPFMQVDTFTSQPLEGNPCAILFDTDILDDAAMLAIAREMNLSETSFVQSSQVADFGARFFTPSEEIPLAGHPTIATIHALIESGRLNLAGPVTKINLELTAGVIPIEIESKDGEVERIIMTQLQPKFMRTYSYEEVMPSFGLLLEDGLENVVPQTVSTGTPQLFIAVNSIEVLKRAQLNIPEYTALKEKGDFFSPHLFIPKGVEVGDTFARHFGLPPDTIEDPFTGSATGGMAAYLWHYGVIDKSKFIAEQGHWMGRPGQAVVEVVGNRNNIEKIRVGGRAVTVIKGEISI